MSTLIFFLNLFFQIQEEHHNDITSRGLRGVIIQGSAPETGALEGHGSNPIISTFFGRVRFEPRRHEVRNPSLMTSRMKVNFYTTFDITNMQVRGIYRTLYIASVLGGSFLEVSIFCKIHWQSSLLLTVQLDERSPQVADIVQNFVNKNSLRKR